MAKLKRKIQWPFISISRRQKLYKDTMTPDEIMNEEKVCHTLYLEANRRGLKEQEKEYMYKRDILRKVLRIDGSTS